MHGSRVDDFLLLLLRTTGSRFPYDPSTHLVGPPLRDPFEKPSTRPASVAVDRLKEIIGGSAVAKVYVDVQGQFPQTVILGQFTPQMSFIDFSHIDGLERSIPGAGLAMAVHDIYERYLFERLPPGKKPKEGETHPAGRAHMEAARLEPLILKEHGLLSGRRLDDTATFTGGAGQQILIQTYLYENFELMIKFKSDILKKPPEFYFISARVQHKIRSGETLQSISKLIYGDPALAPELARSNGLKPDEKPVPGTMLIIPKR